MMKKYFLLVFLALAALIVSCGKTPVSDPVEDEETATPSTPAIPSEPKDYTIKVISYNIRVPSNETNPDNNWPVRKPGTPAMLLAQKPTVFGLQEAVTEQINYIVETAGHRHKKHITMPQPPTTNKKTFLKPKKGYNGKGISAYS